MKLTIVAAAVLLLASAAGAQTRSVRTIPPIKIRQKPPVARIEVPKTARPTSPIQHAPGVHSLPLVG